MKPHFALFVLGTLFGSCEENPDIMLETKPVPVVYSILNRYDTVNYIYLTKTFSGDPFGADFNAGVYDSIYFKEARIHVQVFETDTSIVGWDPRWIDTIAILETRPVREPGMFYHPDIPVFKLSYDLDSVDYVKMQVIIPGYDTLQLGTSLCRKPRLVSPGPQGTWIQLLPWQGTMFIWDAEHFSDLNVRFVIKTAFQSGSQLDTILYSVREVIQSSRISEASLTYNSFLGLLNQHLKVGNDVEYRQIMDISSEIWTSPSSLSSRVNLEFSPLNNDYSASDFSGIKYLGIITSRAKVDLQNIRLDPSTTDYMSRDTALTKFKILFY
jgi:hypothetical protein